MKRFLSGMALAVAISMVSVAPALAVDLMGHTTPGAVNTINSKNYVPKAAFEVKAPLWDTRFGAVNTIDSKNYVSGDTASVRQPLLWHPALVPSRGARSRPVRRAKASTDSPIT